VANRVKLIVALGPIVISGFGPAQLRGDTDPFLRHRPRPRSKGDRIPPLRDGKGLTV
jgi:hypothetical protein